METHPEVPSSIDSSEFIADESHPLSNIALWRPFVGALITAVCFDLGVYRGNGYSGLALGLGGGLLAYLIGGVRQQSHRLTWVMATLLLLVTVRLVWLGSPGLVLCGLVLLPMLAMCGHGLLPYLSDLFVFSMQTAVTGGHALLLRVAEECESRGKFRVGGDRLLAIGLPLVAVVLFGLIFIQANPDVATSVTALLGDLGDQLLNLLEQFNVGVGDLLFVGIVGWIALGQLTPFPGETLSSYLASSIPERKYPREQSGLYEPFRNTLVA
ncbi:MAG: hypothetical protein KDA58_07615, partial [Planctomycetaceae bacterium]|nr:hypothetical protein [Planctomycetaceae bacterium]